MVTVCGPLFLRPGHKFLFLLSVSDLCGRSIGTTSSGLSQLRQRRQLAPLAPTIQCKAMPSTIGEQACAVFFPHHVLACRVPANSVSHLGMLNPCGQPESKAVSHLQGGRL